jgi:predicted dehydrogenase
MHESPGAHVSATLSRERENGLISSTRSLRIGFVGTGWIGQSRLRSVIDNTGLEPIAIVEPNPECASAARAITNDRAQVCSFVELLEMEPDGIVLATPNDLHAEQSIAALEHGVPVFCQKPLGRNFEETHRVIETARKVDRLIGCDFSYRYLDGVRQIRSLLQAGELGRVYDIDLTFHNAYGPAGVWFYDRERSGGGCLIDLGIHLVDLSLWLLGSPEIIAVTSHLFADGKPYQRTHDTVEDHCVATISFSNGNIARVACSWKANIGRGAAIEIGVFGTRGGASLRNIDGSFFDFVAERFHGTERMELSVPPDDWSGRALIDWLTRLRVTKAFDPEVTHAEQVAAVLDRIYNQCAF